ncbi:SUKH-4 family immunity protein [Streptomyces sp. NPDC051555]|uniref:SUKH-4 family immunity protein n=1 Tax=Streptomyces sp. NPDC051555 TaxID=3365657 RepID=UPI00378DDEAA
MTCDDPAALLSLGQGRARELTDSTRSGEGYEVFTQAEAVFGPVEVVRAEFASRLHFAAKVLGRDAYADQVAAAEPGLPWRTVWAWWRPVGAHRAEPNLSGDRSATVFDPVDFDPAQGTADRGPLLAVWSLWTAQRWFDLETGAPRPAPAPGEFAERDEEAQDDGPFLFDTDEDAWALHCPGTWEEPVALGGGRFLIVEARGIAVVERNEAVVEAGWPTGGADHGSWEEATATPWFVAPSPSGAPLDAARVDAVFGDLVIPLPEQRLPAALAHRPTRDLLTAVGLPRHWAAGVSGFALAFGEQEPWAPATDAEGLLHLGTFEFGYADEGKVLLHPETGAVSLTRGDPDDDAPPAPFPFARDTETFLRLLEAVRRFMGACWDPYPAEDGQRDFRAEVSAHAPDALDEATPGGDAWGHLFASITELGVDGY